MKEHNDFILELPNFVPKELCERIIEKFEKSPSLYKGRVNYSGVLQVIPELKNSMETCTCCDPLMKDDIHHEVIKYIKDAEDQYYLRLHNENNYKQQRHMLDTLFVSQPTHEYVPVVQRQSRGGKYVWHFDGTLCRHFDPKVKGFDYAIMMIYLNTLEPEEGGCTEFYHGRKIRPECGKVVIWPASWTYPHNGNEVKGDYKYTMVIQLEKQT